MSEYIVTITETLSREIKVMAISGSDAQEEVKRCYEAGEIVLDYSDMQEYTTFVTVPSHFKEV